ncbi:DUF3617 domain-containing protein [Sulfuricurvum sp.]|uniref:DUF3617 domain-containing protein n=1 Tax=Sulfuricurvum sp. TaxID=2025608 RepID=UPI003C441089
MKHTFLYNGLITLLLTAGIVEGTSIRPGVWEYTTTIKSQNGEIEKAMAQMEQQMASLPPEQRKMMEKSMAAQGVALGSKANSVRVCVTKENAAKKFIPASDGQCGQTIVRQSGNSVWFKFTCKGNPPSSGEGEYTFSGDSAYKGKMTVKTKAQGRTEAVQMNYTGKWISSDCKTIKPH